MIRNVKKHLNVNREDLKKSFERLERVLDDELPKLSSDSIPEVDFQDLKNGRFDDEAEAKIRKHGVIIVRNVFDMDLAKKLYDDLAQYLDSNGENPWKKGQTFFECYWSKSEVEARHHPNMVKVQKALLNLWTTCPGLDDTVDLSQPLTYNDRMRFRKPYDGSFRLDPHLDSGSLNRWADPMYRQSYKEVFDGLWEKSNPFCVKGRGIASMDEHCSFFRAFQGWTSLVEAGPGEGTLKVLPLLKETISYIMMRPFLEDVADDQLPGYEAGKLLHLRKEFHVKLMKAMVSIPKVYPGDTVWWHCDLVHGVEEEHNGKETNTVLYIPVGPDCPLNRLYVERAKNCFMQGLSPPDFHLNPKANQEKYFHDRATKADLNEEGLKMMGFTD